MARMAPLASAQIFRPGGHGNGTQDRKSRCDSRQLVTGNVRGKRSRRRRCERFHGSNVRTGSRSAGLCRRKRSRSASSNACARGDKGLGKLGRRQFRHRRRRHQHGPQTVRVDSGAGTISASAAVTGRGSVAASLETPTHPPPSGPTPFNAARNPWAPASAAAAARRAFPAATLRCCRRSPPTPGRCRRSRTAIPVPRRSLPEP